VCLSIIFLVYLCLVFRVGIDHVYENNTQFSLRNFKIKFAIVCWNFLLVMSSKFKVSD
jgi:hypothetical protein